MGSTLVVHIIAGSLGLVSGFVALYAAKGSTLHRKAGLVFVCVMLTMAVTGSLIAGFTNTAAALNIPIGLLTAYLVVTALLTVRPMAGTSRALDVGLMLVALAIAVADLKFGFEAVANGGMREGMPAFPFFMFAVVASLATAGDLKMLRSGPLNGAPRLARHLWRMSFALLIAALSLFIGRADDIPEPVRIMPVLALPVLAVLVTMFYWLWRVRIRRSLRGIVRIRSAETAERVRA